MPISETADASTAAPGMVGRDYVAGGTVLLSVNPAGGKDDRISDPSDRAMYAAFRALASAQKPDIVEALEAVKGVFARQMPHWRIYKQHTGRILEALGAQLTDIAYIYVASFRTRNDNGARIPVEVVKRAYYGGLDDQLTALAPGLIITMDRHAENVATLYASTDDRSVQTLYYTRKRDAHADRVATLVKLRMMSHALNHQ